ncbi:CPBP family intramembrane glutamic endopeptidase [Thermococcus sp.]|uniref:CPBP family intramembrane glutamic endopeptidase n=1 Tax=Thermococcus sp. TaxID=35749 RepID=UPI0026377A2A|nr:CPBP family intramembrane glutamic endopeptidase [Thermococcus sp.]
MIEFAVALLLWLLIFVPSSIIASLTSRGSPKKAGFVMQLTMFPLSFAVMGAPRRIGKVWIRLEHRIYPPAFILGFGASFVINLLEGSPSVPMEEFMPGGMERLLLLLLLAPLGEEALTRALVEGYLLSYGHFWDAIIFSAMLFALPHWAAYGKSERKRVVVTAGAFILGSVAGYLFALGA